MRDQLYISLYESCKHRPQAATDATALCQIVIAELIRGNTTGLLRRDEIVRTSKAVLGRLDSTAEALYAAYHTVHPGLS